MGDTPEPITATEFAKQFNVSRQTVVGDVALLRALGEDIIATPRGYEYRQAVRHQAVIVCRHTPEETEDELLRIVGAGGTVLDVLIDHPLYGQLRGELQIRTAVDVHLFVSKWRGHAGHLLSELTNGVHLHTVAYDEPEQLAAIKATLRDAGYLYE
ncbi:hypothetical protein FD02_GL000595 [Lacticaseibacillus nasuensis JCM 17158]|uniref:Transcription repressor NadR n=1 Tax=Lacticaseibacillus nasuensis JCM 17158 TaxID=1291734 RepID=A0A0R1JHF9_9LACO|nr:hypothetical protein FD02_GL000595 [Lacticaseibacillus nasuensis JCM 17158]